MSQSERIFHILSLLEKGGGSLRDIVDTFEISERQAKRDIEYLRDRLGAPIVWRRDVDRYELSGHWQLPLPESIFAKDNRFQSAFQAFRAPLALFSTRDGRFLSANPAFLQLFGRSAGDIVGKTPGELGMDRAALDQLSPLLSEADCAALHPIRVELQGKRYLAIANAFQSGTETCVILLIMDLGAILPPEAEGDGIPAALCPRCADMDGEGKRILVVDDDGMVLEMMGCVLSSLGYLPLLASSGTSALEMLPEGGTIDLVVLDVMMPTMDGFEVFRRIQQLRPGLPCLFLSGYSALPLDSFLSEPAVRGCLQKPLARAELGKALKKALAV